MQVSDLYTMPVESKLMDWLNSFATPEELFANISQLYATLSEQLILGTLGTGVSVTGPVHIGAGAVVGANSVLFGPLVIGENVEIGPCSVLKPGSYIGSECRLEAGVFVSSSLILNRSRVAEMAIIRSSVLGAECEVGTRASIGVSDCPAPASAAPNVDTGTFLGDSVRIGTATQVGRGSLIGARSTVVDGLQVNGLFQPDTVVSA